MHNFDSTKVGHCANRNGCVYDELIDDDYGSKKDAIKNHHSKCNGDACYDYRKKSTK